MSIDSGGRSPSRFSSHPGYAVLHVQGELATQVGIEPLQRLVQSRLVRGDEVEIPLRQLAVAIDPAAPAESANRLGLQIAKALDESARDRLLANRGPSSSRVIAA